MKINICLKHPACRAGAIFAIALIVRVIIIWKTAAPPINDGLWNDATGWNLAQGNGFTASNSEPFVPAIFRPPGYPLFLAGIYSLFGHFYMPVYVVQAIVDSLTALLVVAICHQLSLPHLSFPSGLLYAFYPYPAIFCGTLGQDILLTFFAVLSLLVTLIAKNNTKKLRLLSIAGLILGMTIIIKPFLAMLFILPISIIIVDKRKISQKILSLFVMLLPALALILPLVLRNYLLFNSFPPLAVGGTGTNLQYLIIELTEGERTLIEKYKVESLKKDDVKSAEYIRNFVDGKQLIEIEREKALKAFSELKKHKKEYMMLILKHIPRLWITKYAMGRPEIISIFAFWLSIIFLTGLTLGLYISRNMWQILWPLYIYIVIITISYAFYTAEARYTLPARPVAIVFIANLLISVFGYMKTVICRVKFS